MTNLPDPAEDTSSVPLETIQASPWHRYAHIYPNLLPNFLNYSLIWNCVCLKWNSEISSRDAQASFGPLSWAAPHSSTNFSVDTHCSGIHFPPDSLQNPDLSLILRPFVIQKTGINNKLYMTESKEQKKKKKEKWSAPTNGLLHGRERKSFFMAAVSHHDVYSRLKWIIKSVMWEKYVEQKY